MNENRRGKNNNSPDGNKAKLVIAVIFAIFVFLDAIGGDPSAFIGIIIFAVVIALVVIGIKKSKDGAASGAGAESTTREDVRREPAAKREFKPVQFDMSKFAGKGESLSKRLTEKMRDDLTRCDDDHDHVEPDYAAEPSEKRASQLREMLKNGIIEKDEYNILMRKYGLK